MALLKIVSGQNPREIAARVLGRRHGTIYVEDLLEKELSSHGLPPADRRLCQELVYGTVRWERTLDWLIARKTQNRVQKRPLQILLRLGLYQIFWLDRIPDHAAVHQTVEMARQAGFGPQSGFINAVLRGYLREDAVTRQALDALKKEDPALGYSHPAWLVDRWQARWGAADLVRLLEWNNSIPHLYARVNTLKTDPGKLLEQWRLENVEYDFVRRDWFEDNLVFQLKSHPPLHRVESFRQGLFYIQDPSTLLAVRELEPAPNLDVLDFCAAPGGKLTYIAQLMGKQGRLAAHDHSPERVKLLQENCARLGVACALLSGSPAQPLGVAGVAQAQAPSLPPSGLYDRVLVDAPCSNTGVMRRRVDLRWRVEPAEIERLRTVQLNLLNDAAHKVKPGGRLVYSTCSLEPEENGSVAEEFLRAQPDFRMERSRQLTPFADQVDGAFTALFVRNDFRHTEQRAC